MTYLDYIGLYFLIGTVFAIGLQAWAKRKEPRLTQGDFIQGVVYMFIWPVMLVVTVYVFAVDDFLIKLRNEGIKNPFYKPSDKTEDNHG